MPCVREVEVSQELTLKIEECESLEDSEAAVVWDCGLVLSHYLIHAVSQGTPAVFPILVATPDIHQSTKFRQAADESGKRLMKPA
jgi:hypothetical protein